MDKGIKQIIDDCHNGKEVEISEDLLIEFFPVKGVAVLDKDVRREMRKEMNYWLERTESFFGIEWILHERTYCFRELPK